MSLDCEREPEYPREHTYPQGEQKSPSQPLDTRTVASVLIREFALQSTDNETAWLCFSTLYIILTCERWSVTRFSATSPTHCSCTTFFFTHQVVFVNAFPSIFHCFFVFHYLFSCCSTQANTWWLVSSKVQTTVRSFQSNHVSNLSVRRLSLMSNHYFFHLVCHAFEFVFRLKS